MIQFFDPHATGDDQMLYNGEMPYIHWGEPCSTGIIRYVPIFFISDKKTITAGMELNQNPFTGVPTDWVFALYNPKRVDAEMFAIDWNSFCDLHAVATNSVELNGQSVKLDGKDVYAYQLIILCKSDVEGEFIHTFTIDGTPYKVGVEFYGENEALKINLANQGTEIPDMVYKAIYGSELYDTGVDWVLLNRKFRELMTSHMDIMDNKGSYKSLLNALKWFEYENLVELREVWKYDTPAGTKYYERPVQTIVTEEIKDRMFNSSKTTYFALRHLKTIITKHNAGNNPVFAVTTFEHDPDDSAAVESIACIWSEEEMKLKMVLLGNFFETYFMPVHANLIRSVVEDLCNYDFTLEVGAGECIHDNPAPAETFDFSWGDDGDPDSPDYDPYNTHESTLEEVHVYAGLAQSNPYGQAFENTAVGYSMRTVLPIIACHTYDEAASGSDSVQVHAAMAGQIYNGIGAVEVAHFDFPEPIISGICTSNQWGEPIETSFSGITTPASWFDIKFLFPYPGEFEFVFEFVGESGKHYSKTVNINVVDNLRVDIACYKLQTKPDYIYKTINPFTDATELRYMFSMDRDMNFEVNDEGDLYTVKSLELEPAYTQFIPARMSHRNIPADAPSMTKMRTIQWISGKVIDDRNKFYANMPKDNYWYELGDDTEYDAAGNVIKPATTAWIRVCNKQRDGEPPVVDVTGPYRVFDLEVFFPELHRLVPIKSHEVVDPAYPIVIVPELFVDGKGESKRVKYSLAVSDPKWEFYSYGLVRVIEEFNRPITTPILARTLNNIIPPGAYKITFKYKFGNEERTVSKSTDWTIAK